MRVSALRIGGEPEAWRSLGFAVDDAGVVMAGPIRLELVPSAEREVIRSWTLVGEDVPDSIDGLATEAASRAGPEGEHPNGVTGIDHVVVLTPSLERTTAAFAELGLRCRRVREAGEGVRQGFFVLGDLLVEVVEAGGIEPHEPARFWGITLAVADIDRAAQVLGKRLREVKDAVQPGRRIATVRREASGGLPLALITPR